MIALRVLPLSVRQRSYIMLYFLLSESDVIKFICHDFYSIPVSKRNKFETYEAAAKARNDDAKHHLKILKVLRNGSYSIIDR